MPVKKLKKVKNKIADTKIQMIINIISWCKDLQIKNLQGVQLQMFKISKDN